MNVTLLRTLLRKYGGWIAPLVGAALLFHALRRRKVAAFAALSVFPLLSVGFALLRPTAREMRVTFLDVGKGDSAVIETPSGRVIVIDTGDATAKEGDQGEKVVAPYLRSRNIRRIDILILTHPHNDHISGAMALLKQFSVGQIVENGCGADSKRMQRIREEAEKRKIAIRCVAQGDTLDFGADAQACLVSPARDADFGTKENAYSLVLRVAYRKTAFLFTGDANGDAEKAMLKTRQTLTCDVLKAGHHGHQSSTLPDFLAAVHPRVAIISVDADNRAGMPHDATLKRLEKIGAKVYRTDKNGSVTCRTDGATLQVTPERGNASVSGL